MDVDSSSKPGASSMVPLGIGLLGLVIGVIALFMSFSNSSAVKDLATLKDTVSAASTKADDAKTASDGIAGKVDANTNTIAAMRTQIVDFANQVKTAIDQNTTDIKALQGQVASRGSSTPKSSGGTSSTATSTVVPGQGGDYVIQANDNFSSLARRFGVSLKDIEAANPGVESNKLKIGQHITIPAAHGSTSAPAPVPSASTSSPAPAVAP